MNIREFLNNNKVIAAVDPSINALGVCIMSDTFKIVFSKVFKTDKRASWDSRAMTMCSYVETIIKEHMPDVLLIEHPEYWDSETGRQARESGSIHKLYFLCGRLHGILYPLCNKVLLVGPSQWKGQLNKTMAARRIQREFGDWVLDLDHNEADAIGIAFSYLTDWKLYRDRH